MNAMPPVLAGIMDSLSVEGMSPEELVRAARLWGIDIRRFES